MRVLNFGLQTVTSSYCWMLDMRKSRTRCGCRNQVCHVCCRCCRADGLPVAAAPWEIHKTGPGKTRSLVTAALSAPGRAGLSPFTMKSSPVATPQAGTLPCALAGRSCRALPHMPFARERTSHYPRNTQRPRLACPKSCSRISSPAPSTASSRDEHRGPPFGPTWTLAHESLPYVALPECPCHFRQKVQGPSRPVVQPT